MEQIATVSRMEDIAFMTCYREIVANLLLSPDHHPTTENRVGMFRGNEISYSSWIALNPFCTSPNILQFVRSRLNEHLIGIMSDDIRKKLLKQFNLPNSHDQNNWDGKCDIWPFLDCVLDSSFTKLDTHVCSPSSMLNEKVIQTIAKRSPNIEELKLNFINAERETLGETLKPFVNPLSSLANLTSLTIYSLKECHRSILKYLGYSCPKLKHISMSGFKFGIVRQDVVALLLGEKLESLPEKESLLNEENDEIHHLQISPEYLAPFCSTLQWLQLEDLNNFEEQFNLCSTDVAFVIRHIPNLRRITHYSESVASAVKLLDDIENDFFHKFHTNAGYSVPWITNSPKNSGTLLLTSLDFVEIQNPELMRAIGNMCPNLKEVCFVQMYCSDTDARTYETQEELSSILTTWSKVERVTFKRDENLDSLFPDDIMKTVLSSIGAQLLHITIMDCDDIEIVDLFPCTRLEVLRFIRSTLYLVIYPGCRHKILSLPER